MHMDEGGALVWPVMFLYPEYGQTDFIKSFNENDRYACVGKWLLRVNSLWPCVRFLQHIEVMFEECAPWDVQGAYTPTNIKVDV